MDWQQNMDKQHVHTALICRMGREMDMHHGDIDMQPCINMNMQYENGTFSTDIDMQYVHVIDIQQRKGRTVRTWACSMDMPMQQGHGRGHAEWKSTFSMGMEHGHWTRACSRDKGMQQGQGHAAGTRAYSSDMDMQH